MSFENIRAGDKAGARSKDESQVEVEPSSQLGANFAVRRYKAIVFSVKRRIWRKNDDSVESADEDYKAIRPTVLSKGGFKCVHCGFVSKYTEVHHVNDVHSDNRLENLDVSDPYCHGCSHIGQVGSRKHGIFIHIDGLPQAELNHLQRTIAVVLATGSESDKREASALLQHLASRGQLVSKTWGSANPSDFANAMLNLREEDFAKREYAMFGLQLLFKPVRFAEYISRWVEESYKSLPVRSWTSIYDRTQSRT